MMSGIVVLLTVHMSGIETISGDQVEVTEIDFQPKESDFKG